MRSKRDSVPAELTINLLVPCRVPGAPGAVIWAPLGLGSSAPTVLASYSPYGLFLLSQLFKLPLLSLADSPAPDLVPKFTITSPTSLSHFTHDPLRGCLWGSDPVIHCLASKVFPEV